MVLGPKGSKLESVVTNLASIRLQGEKVLQYFLLGVET